MSTKKLSFVLRVLFWVMMSPLVATMWVASLLIVWAAMLVIGGLVIILLGGDPAGWPAWLQLTTIIATGLTAAVGATVYVVSEIEDYKTS